MPLAGHRASSWVLLVSRDAPKELLLALETGHFRVPEQNARIARWIEEQVGRRPAE